MSNKSGRLSEVAEVDGDPLPYGKNRTRSAGLRGAVPHRDAAWTIPLVRASDVPEKPGPVVLGIDPSLCNLGLAVVALDPEGERVLETSVVRTEPSAKRLKIRQGDDTARRVACLAAGLAAAIDRHHPAALVVETPGGSKGARAAAALASAMAMVVTVAQLRGLPLVQVQPLDVKRAVCGRKAASKKEIIVAIEARCVGPWDWQLPKSTWEHQADAIGAVLAALETDVLRMVRRAA